MILSIRTDNVKVNKTPNNYDDDENFATWEEAANNYFGIFDGEPPYVIEAINWDQAAYDETYNTSPAPVEEPEPAPVVVVPAVRTPLPLNQYSIAYDDAGSPYNSFYMAAALNGVGYSGISPRAFADFIGGTTAFDTATNTATITGTSSSGQEISVALTVNSASAVAAGQTVDIAEYNENTANYPAGSIVPFQPGNNRIYVPVRFMCKAFGVQFTWDPVTQTVTLY